MNEKTLKTLEDLNYEFILKELINEKKVLQKMSLVSKNTFSQFLLLTENKVNSILINRINEQMSQIKLNVFT
jgi:hypothetical protein